MKVKRFIKNHKKAIIIGVSVVAGFALGIYGTNKFISNRKMISGTKEYLPFDNLIKNVLFDAHVAYPDLHTTATFMYEDPVKVNELGVLGKKLIEDGRQNQTFTHFIAIGKDMTNGK